MKKILVLTLAGIMVFSMTVWGSEPVTGSDNKEAADQEALAAGYVPDEEDAISDVTKTTPDDGQNPIMNFIGVYVCDRARVEVMPKGDDAAEITVIWGSSAFDSAQWTMSGVLDTDTLEVSYSDCEKKIVAYDRDSEGTDQSPEETIEYTEGSGTILFGEDGTLAWNDDQEHIADGMVFEYIVNVDPAQEASGEITQADIEKNIVGTWVKSETDGQPALTNEKNVFDIVSITEDHSSVSRIDEGGPFVYNDKSIVDINGNVVTITTTYPDGESVVHELTITGINNSEFTANRKFTHTFEEADPIIKEDAVAYIKVNDDYKGDIIGTWEGHCTSEGSVFDDGQDHRWEYKDDGTYVYYVKDGDDWVPSEDTLNEYFVAGNLLCLRWMENGQENREWWEVTIDGDKMNWTALREGEDGKTFTATFEMTKVEE